MAKSSAPRDPTELLDLLSRSGLADAQQQQTITALLAEQADVNGAAQQLVRDKLLTSWQAEQLLAGQFVLKLGAYALESEAGPWEFGRAFVARHTGTVGAD